MKFYFPTKFFFIMKQNYYILSRIPIKNPKYSKKAKHLVTQKEKFNDKTHEI